MPSPVAQISYNPSDCINNLPPFGVLPAEVHAEYCTPVSNFDYSDGDNPQPYLTWSLPVTNCVVGAEGELCKPYSSWLAEAESHGGQVGFNIWDASDGANRLWQISAPELFVFTVPDLNCETIRTFRVQFWVQVPGEFTVFSDPSPAVGFLCPKPPIVVESLDLKITFETLHLANVDDGINGGDNVEVFGHFTVAGADSLNGLPRYLQISRWGAPAKYTCPDDIQVTFNVRSFDAPNCGPRIGNGTFELVTEGFCESFTYYHCPGEFVLGHNFTNVRLAPGDQLTIGFGLYDYDGASANDGLCRGLVKLPQLSLEQWPESQELIVHDFISGDATCTVRVTIEQIDEP
jgi:hypothetical protein